MLKKENRISLNKDFDRVFKTGQSFYGKILGFKLAKNNTKVSRFGIIISAKISKKAVVRNRIKRQLREIIQSELPNLKKGQDLVLIAFPLILDKNFEELKKILKKAFERFSLYK